MIRFGVERNVLVVCVCVFWNGLSKTLYKIYRTLYKLQNNSCLVNFICLKIVHQKYLNSKKISDVSSSSIWTNFCSVNVPNLSNKKYVTRLFFKYFLLKLVNPVSIRQCGWDENKNLNLFFWRYRKFYRHVHTDNSLYKLKLFLFTLFFFWTAQDAKIHRIVFIGNVFNVLNVFKKFKPQDWQFLVRKTHR